MYVLRLRLEHNVRTHEFFDRRFRHANAIKNKAIYAYNMRERNRQSSEEYRKACNLLKDINRLESKDTNEQVKNEIIKKSDIAKNMFINSMKTHNTGKSSFAKYTNIKDVVQFSQNDRILLKSEAIQGIVSDVQNAKNNRIDKRKSNKKTSLFIPFSNIKDFNYIDLTSLGSRKITGFIDNGYFKMYKGKSSKDSEKERFKLIMTDSDKSRLDYALNNGKIKRFGIKREMGRNGLYQYFLYIIVDGMPLERNGLTCKGRVGIDLGVSTVAAVNEYGDVLLESLDCGVHKYEKERSELQSELDRLSRLHNPDYFLDNGVPKRITRELYKSHSWIKTKRMKKIEDKIKNSYLRESQSRKINHRRIVNKIMAMGDEFYVEDMNIKEWQEKLSDEKAQIRSNKLNKQGCAKKKNHGKAVNQHAPAMLIDILKEKLNYVSDTEHVFKINAYKTKLSQYDHISNSYHKKELTQRYHVVGQDCVHRDLYSAFLMANMKLVGKDLTVDRKSCFNNYDVFKTNHDIYLKENTDWNKTKNKLKKDLTNITF